MAKVKRFVCKNSKYCWYLENMISFFFFLGNWWYRIVRWAHLSEYFIKPLQRPVQVDFNPARSTGHVLTMIFGAPAFDKRHSDCAHFGEFIDGFETMINRLRKQLSKFLIVENFERAAGRDFAYGRRVESVVVIAITRLDEYGRVRQTFSVHFSSNII